MLPRLYDKRDQRVCGGLPAILPSNMMRSRLEFSHCATRITMSYHRKLSINVFAEKKITERGPTLRGLISSLPRTPQNYGKTPVSSRTKGSSESAAIFIHWKRKFLKKCFYHNGALMHNQLDRTNFFSDFFLTRTFYWWQRILITKTILDNSSTICSTSGGLLKIKLAHVMRRPKLFSD